MKWIELGELINKLSDEQKEMTVKGWSENTPITDGHFTIESEDMYYNSDWDYCEIGSNLEKEDLENAHTILVLKKGTPYIFF